MSRWLFFKCETTKMKSAKNIKNGFYAKTFSYSVIFYQILMLCFLKFLTFPFNSEFSLVLMKDIKSYCDKTLKKTNSDIPSTENHQKQQNQRQYRRTDQQPTERS